MSKIRVKVILEPHSLLYHVQASIDGLMWIEIDAFQEEDKATAAAQQLVISNKMAWAIKEGTVVYYDEV